MSKVAVRATVSGRVQQVGFRQTCRQVARSLDLAGWVRNLPDGRVEWMAQGDREAVERLTAWSWRGPSLAVVTGIESESVPVDPLLSDFVIQPNPAKDR